MKRGTLLGWLLLLLWAPAGAGGEMKQSDWNWLALHEKLPKAPPLIQAPDSTGLLLLDVRPTIGFVGSGAVLERIRDHELIKMAPLDKNLFLFPDLEEGSYVLRIVRLSNSHFGILGSPTAMILPEDNPIRVDVPRGGLTYEGLVRVRIRTLWNSNAYLDASTVDEADALDRFGRKYPDSPWAKLASARADSLKTRSGP